jgi:hypothetical protein
MSRDVIGRFRAFLLATLTVGILGTAAELLLLGHVESAQQLIPLVLLAAAVVVVVWHAAVPQLATIRLLQVTMLMFVLSGLVGISLHFKGNVEFELEMYPSMTGVELVTKTLTGATPVLAPGTMTLLGLIGLTYTYAHPSLRGPVVGLPIDQEGDS